MEHESEDILYANYLNPHPLLIPSIVSFILHDFSYSELKQFRLVCTSWEDEASAMLKTKTQIRFPSEKSVSTYITQLDQNYCCDSYEFAPDIGLSSPEVRGFFDMFGGEIKSLKLHQVRWSGPQLWEILSSKLPFLEELSVRIFIPRDANFLPEGGDGGTYMLPTIRILRLNFSIDKPFKQHPPPPFEVVCPTILKELLQAMPNLEEISCPSWPTYIRPDKVVSNLFYNVIFQYPEIQLPRLSYINMNAALDSQQLYKLMDKNFALRELRLELYPDVKPYYFYFLLKGLERTLTRLILIFHPDYDAENFDEFPVLKNLEYLALHKYCGPIHIIVRYLPGLKRLLLNDSFVTDDDLFYAPDEGRFHLNQLEELVIEGMTWCAYAQLTVLSRNFPNLMKLKVQDVDDSMLRLIFERLTLLEELEADGKFTDAGVSGIPLNICQNIFEVPDVDRVRIFPYVGRLQNLRSLTFTSWNISYLSVLLGVNDCKLLRFNRLMAPKLFASC